MSCIQERRHTAWKNSKLCVPWQQIAPRPSPGQTWIKGKINHFNFDKFFGKYFDSALTFLTTKSYRGALDMPYNPDAALPDRWHEGHEPTTSFLNTEGAQLPKELRARSASLLPLPPGR